MKNYQMRKYTRFRNQIAQSKTQNVQCERRGKKCWTTQTKLKDKKKWLKWKISENMHVNRLEIVGEEYFVGGQKTMGPTKT